MPFHLSASSSGASDWARGLMARCVRRCEPSFGRTYLRRSESHSLREKTCEWRRRRWEGTASASSLTKDESGFLRRTLFHASSSAGISSPIRQPLTTPRIRRLPSSSTSLPRPPSPGAPACSTSSQGKTSELSVGPAPSRRGFHSLTAFDSLGRMSWSRMLSLTNCGRRADHVV
jgi:hypothetical protein